MATRYAYLEQCLDMHAQISAGDFTPGSSKRTEQSHYSSFRSIGQVALPSGQVMFIGQKTPLRKSPLTTWQRVYHELRLGSVIAARCPGLLPLLPRFIGTQDDTMLTEDMSEGGRHRPVGIPASAFVRTSLDEGFREFADGGAITRTNMLNNGMCLSTFRGERIADLTPSPLVNAVRRTAYRNDPGLNDAIYEVAEQLQFDLPIPKQ